MIGADPEFGFLKDGYVVHAAYVVDDDSNQQEFGLDGSDSVAEIRPKPSTDPAQVVSNIRRAMFYGIRNYEKTRSHTWKAGSVVDTNPVGGHIHFGVEGLLKRGQTFQTKLLPPLDSYLAHPVLLLEDPEEAAARREHGYGTLSDTRPQDWGFEYRTLSSWLTSPYIAIGVLSLAKAVVWEALYNGLGAFKPFEGNGDKFCDADVTLIREHFDRLWRDIRKFELY